MAGLAAFTVYVFARLRGMSAEVMVLAGIATLFLFQSLQSMAQYLASPEVLQQALANAEEVLKAAGGCIDSLSFGREWRDMFPDFDRSAFKGTPVTSFNKLLSLYGGDTFSVEATKKKEVNASTNPWLL